MPALFAAEHLRVVAAADPPTPLGPTDDGDDRLQLTTTEPWSLADQLVTYGADVVVESPAVIREAVIQRLTRLSAGASA